MKGYYEQLKIFTIKGTFPQKVVNAFFSSCKQEISPAGGNNLSVAEEKQTLKICLLTFSYSHNFFFCSQIKFVDGLPTPVSTK
jgi:hypothetical protein